MKKYIMLLLLAVATLGASAQSTRVVSGAVIDKNGNPLPGATVSATGGAETTLTQSDGTFSLEVPIWLKSLTASYAGMDDKKLRTDFNRDMIFTMKPAFNKAWFINATAGCSIGDYSYLNLGFMAGRLGKWGYYAKLNFPVRAHIDNVQGYAYGIQGIVGGIKSISKRVYFYLGAGYGGISYEDYEIEFDPGVAFEAGFLFRIGSHFNLGAGYTHTCDFEGWWNCNPNISLGYVF